jgi:hypothetical protein
MSNRLDEFIQRLSPKARQTFLSFRAPVDIQNYLDEIPYVAEERDRTPLELLHDGQGHCLDGGFFAALALRQLGFPSLVIDLIPEPGLDDDHVLAIFQMRGRWGAIAKGNFVGLRYREPVYKSLRELAMSYFQNYFNIEGQRTLRGYTRPINLGKFDDWGWMWDVPAFMHLAKRFYTRKWIPLITPEIAAALTPLDERSYNADTLGFSREWAFGVRPD